MMEQNLEMYEKTEDGHPICPTCGTGVESATVISESVIGVGTQRGVTGQGYRFYPCEHEAEYDLPMGGGG